MSDMKPGRPHRPGDYEHRNMPSQMALHGLLPGKLLPIAAGLGLFILVLGIVLLSAGVFE